MILQSLNLTYVGLSPVSSEMKRGSLNSPITCNAPIISVFKKLSYCCVEQQSDFRGCVSMFRVQDEYWYCVQDYVTTYNLVLRLWTYLLKLLC